MVSLSVLTSFRWPFLLCFLNFLPQSNGNGGWGIRVEERHAFSLSTFNPKGQLQQVDYAMEAAALGTPVLVVYRPQEGTLVLAAPQALPSIFVQDDGTARFNRISSTILVAHSGISADGRVLCAAAQDLAIQHEYVYDEEIPIDIFLEEVSLLYQEYTMKPNTRPFGATMIVAHLADNNDDDDSSSPAYSNSTIISSKEPHCFYRIDPSGAVECLGDNYGVINGGDKFQKDDELWDGLKDISQDPNPQSVEETREKMVQALLQALRRASEGTKSLTTLSSKNHTKKEDQNTDDSGSDENINVDGSASEYERVPATLRNVRRILTASLSPEEGMAMDRFELLHGKIVQSDDDDKP